MKKGYIYLATLAHMINDSSQSVVPALMYFIVKEFGISYEAAGALIFANTALSSVLQPILGYYADKFSAPRLIALGVLLSSLSIASISFATSYTYIFIAVMIAGIGSAIFHPEGAKLANKLGGANVGKSIGTFAVGGSAGYALGPIIAGVCVYTVGLKGLLIYAVMGILMATSLAILMPRIIEYTEEIKTDLVKKAPHVYGVEPKNDWKSFGKLSLVLFCRAINFSVINAFIPIYWVVVLQLSPPEGSLALTILFSIGVVVTYIGGILADRYGFVKVLRYALVLWVPATFFITNVTSPFWAWLALIPLGFARTVVYSPVVVLGQKYLAKSVGFASGITIGLTMTLGGIVTPGVGLLADNFGVQNALQVLNVSTVIALIASFFLTEENMVMKKEAEAKLATSAELSGQNN